MGSSDGITAVEREVRSGVRGTGAFSHIRRSLSRARAFVMHPR